jgi:arylsulfatase A-like enzyme
MKKPNIIIITSDQMSADAISCLKNIYRDKAYGAHWLKTPNLDRMIENGRCFTRSASANPVCSPARSAIFTGRMPLETGIVYNNIGIDRNVPNMGEWFSENSEYDAWYCGKWHAGGKWNYPGIEGSRKIPGFSTLPGSSRGTGDVADYEVSSSSVSFIKSFSKGNPFLLAIGLMNPHDICFWGNNTQVPADNHFNILESELPILPPNLNNKTEEPFKLRRTRFSDKSWKNYRYDYYRMIEKMDADVGRIIEAVDSRSDQTIVIFTADHGDGAGRHSLISKWFPYEEALMVPFIVYAPGMIRQGVDTRHIVSGVDIMSTVCDYAGIPAPLHQRGLSLKPLLEGHDGKKWRDHVYAEFMRTGRIIVTEKYKFVKYYEPSGLPETDDKHFVLKGTGEPSPFIPGKGHLFSDRQPRLLFNLENDPWEMTNLATHPEFKEIVDQHELLLKEWEDKLIPGTHYDRN